MKLKRSALILSLLMMAQTLAACGETASGNPNVTADTTDAVVTEPEDPFVKDDLPELDFEGAVVNIFVGDYNNAYWNDFYAEEENGNRINDTIYSMNNAVQERLNVTLNYTQYTYTWAQSSEYANHVIQQVLAGSDEMDISIGANFIAQQAEAQYFMNLNDSKYIDFDKPWWNKTIISAMPTDYVHFATGDGTLAAIKHTLCIFFNQNMLTDYGVTDNLYDLVEDGTWTLDKLESYSKLFYKDVNGDTKKDFEDIYGLTFGDQNKYLGFINSLGITIAEKDKDGYKITFGSERACDVVTRLCALVNDNNSVYPAIGNSDNEILIATGGGNYASKVFVEGRSAFSAGLVQDAATIVPSVKFSCGILPYPKWDEAQTDYVSQLQRNCYFTIPVSTVDFERACAVLEAWSSLAYRQLQPEYFEVSLKVRYTEGDQMAAMFDLLRSSLNFDIGEIFAPALSTPSAQIKTNISSNNTDWASWIASKIDSWESKLAEMWTAYSAY